MVWGRFYDMRAGNVMMMTGAALLAAGLLGSCGYTRAGALVQEQGTVHSGITPALPAGRNSELHIGYKAGAYYLCGYPVQYRVDRTFWTDMHPIVRPVHPAKDKDVTVQPGPRLYCRIDAKVAYAVVAEHMRHPQDVLWLTDRHPLYTEIQRARYAGAAAWQDAGPMEQEWAVPAYTLHESATHTGYVRGSWVARNVLSPLVTVVVDVPMTLLGNLVHPPCTWFRVATGG